MFRVRSFQTRVLLAILIVALVPAAVAIALGYGALREVGAATGTLGPWDAVAASGRTLLDEVERSAAADSAVRRAAAAHASALSESVRWSRLYAFVTQRALAVLPLAALATLVAIALLALGAARRVARGVAAPVRELAEWTRAVAREEPLPAPAGDEARDVEEIRALRAALREMDAGLRAGRRRAVEAARLRTWTEMARRVAHELKNPLTPMRMAATTLARSAEPGTAAAAGVMLEEVDRLDAMARAFAQLGRMPEGPPSEVDLGEMLETLALRHGRERAPVRVEVEPDLPRVLAHHDLLARAVLNLLLNALDAQEGRPGEVVLAAARASDGRAAVTVRDRGPGVPAGLIEEIWHPDVTTKTRGTGLGLAIVRQAATAHGGEATVTNRPDGGAEFTLLLPVGGPPPSAPAGARP